MKCPFCGHEFEAASAQVACAGCPVMPGCHLLRCPRCGYEMPPEAKLVGLIRRLRDRVRAAPSRSQDTAQRNISHG